MRGSTVRLVVAAAGAAAVVAGAMVRSAAQNPAPAPTFNRHVAPIVFANCVPCHRPGGVAPFSLLSYDEAQPHAEAIEVMVRERAMPPWYADPAFGEFKNARALTQAQIDTIVAWADAGAPEGDGRPPDPPRFEQTGWRMSRAPDLVLDLPFGEFQLPPQGEVPTFTVWMKLPLRDDRWVQAIEMRPSVRGAVHHSSISLAPDLPLGTRLGRAPVFTGGPVLDGVPVYDDGRPFRTATAEAFGMPIMFYVPGGGFMQFADGLAKRFGRDDWVTWGLHLISPGRPDTVRVQIGLWYARREPHHEVKTWTVNQTVLVDGKAIVPDANGRRAMPDIPAGASSWAVTGTLKVEEDITIHAMWPHMHYRGKDMRFVVTQPNGRQETILNVPHYNPHWQIMYELARPLGVRRGSTITAYGHYDNSAANPHNPDPGVPVRFGPQGTDEMFIPFLEVTVDDEDLRFERQQELLGIGRP
ncbi:MAG: hypothetical protein HY657_12085 [Acidobacteria bacterium]|nr:hypothetical protein [Acidobacteriota bacterium]